MYSSLRSATNCALMLKKKKKIGLGSTFKIGDSDQRKNAWIGTSLTRMLHLHIEIVETIPVPGLGFRNITLFDTHASLGFACLVFK